MATSSIKAPIMVTSDEGVKALCKAYERGIADDSKAAIKNPPRADSVAPEKKKAIDELFSAMGF